MMRTGWFFLLLAAVAGGCQRAEHAPSAAQPAAQGSAAGAASPTAIAANVSPAKPLTGPELYAQHCAACHGDSGNGQGIAATFLFPKPRNLRTGSFRLVSTVNGNAAPADIEAVLVRGMPGSSMPPWSHLRPEERALLVGEVLRLRREGQREDFIRDAKEQGEEQIDEAAVEEFVEGRLTPGAALEVPPLGPADAEAVARGKALYIKQGCNSCHGNEGRGDGQQKMVDSEGFPTRPRDLTRGIYKGSPEPDSLYRRIALGMAGTPMPASANLKPEEIGAMVHFLRSLSSDERRQAAVLQRRELRVARVAAAPDSPAGWEAVPAVAISTVPLWWRDNADTDLKVQAVHDGRVLALRLTWKDDTQNVRAVRPDEFEDMVAAQWSASSQEPFLGMGSADARVEVWNWRAGTAATGTEDQLMDEYPEDREPAKHAVNQKQFTDFETASAVGNPLSIRQHSAASLGAKGPGSITFRPPVSQLVQASGAWKDGRWDVVLVRPLSVADGQGIGLTPGAKYSVAFAVWDGAQRDRAGQKLISIWNDLRLE